MTSRKKSGVGKDFLEEWGQVKVTTQLKTVFKCYTGICVGLSYPKMESAVVYHEEKNCHEEGVVFVVEGTAVFL